MTDEPTSHEVQQADPPSDAPLYCPSCMYDLRALRGDACPECGEALDRAALKQSAIPWLYRKRFLPLLPLWRTSVFVTFRQKRFYAELARPVDLKQAQAYRTTLAGLVMLALLLPLALGFFLSEVYWLDWFEPIDDVLPELSSVRSAVLIYGLVALFFFVMGLMGLHTYWFHPRKLPMHLQNRSVAMSYYAWSPMVFMIVPSLIFCGGLILLAIEQSHFSPGDMGVPLMMVSLTISVCLLVCGWLVCSNLLRLSHRLAGRSWAGALGMLAGTGLSALGLALLLFGVIPVVVLYAFLIVGTL